MSSWIIAKGIPKKKSVAPITAYHDTTSSHDIPSIYMDVLAAYIYNVKLGNTCSIWDPSGIISTSLTYNPQIKLLKEKPETPPQATSMYQSIVSSMKFREHQKYAATVLDYKPVFNSAITSILDKGTMKKGFDIGLHIMSSTSAETLPLYIEIVKSFQAKMKKSSFSIYLMTDSYETVKEFQKLGNSSWNVVSLSRNAPKDPSDIFLHMMADVEILRNVPAVILDFTLSIDRYIYLLQRNQIGYQFFKEIHDQPWFLI